MNYLGSKRLLCKHILPIMLSAREMGQWWVEPFVGGGNVISEVYGKRIGADVDRHAIDALVSIRDCVDELPKNNKEFTEEDYKLLRKNDDYRHKGYTGYAFSFGAKWLGGWKRYSEKTRDCVREAYNSALRQSPKLQGVILVCRDYRKLEIPSRSLVYCDPPYKGTTGYNNKIDHDEFWEWCRTMSLRGHTVFISEYSAPDDFTCVWEMPSKSNCLVANRKSGITSIERLFTYTGRRKA